MSKIRRNRRARILICSAAVILLPIASADAKGFQVLYSFTGGADGGGPASPLIRDAEGNFYSTTYAGGTYNDGVLFKLSPNGDGSWTETAPYSFAGGNDGINPNGLIADNEGNFYGTTAAGGANNDGIVFKLSSSDGGNTWQETVIHTFNGSDGAVSYAALVSDKKGRLYGTTYAGGDTGNGVVFRLSNKNGSWKEEVLHSFSGGNDGAQPIGALVGYKGNFYGVTTLGGAGNWGTIFKIAPDGTEAPLYVFCQDPPVCTDGAFPQGDLAVDGHGNLYGVALGGGPNDQGVAFEVTQGGSETVLYNFIGGDAGGNPLAGLTRENDSNLYGTAEGGVQGCYFGYGCGVVFRLRYDNGSWTEKILHEFNGDSDGGSPIADLYRNSDDGYLYGTAYTGNGNPNGTVFRVKK